MKINDEIESEAKKIVEARFEKLCLEKGQIIKELEKKIKDLKNEINQIELRYGSYLKVKRWCYKRVIFPLIWAQVKAITPPHTSAHSAATDALTPALVAAGLFASS